MARTSMLLMLLVGIGLLIQGNNAEEQCNPAGNLCPKMEGPWTGPQTVVPCCHPYLCVPNFANQGVCSNCTSINLPCWLTYGDPCCPPNECRRNNDTQRHECRSCLSFNSQCDPAKPCCRDLSCQNGHCLMCLELNDQCDTTDECCPGLICEQDLQTEIKHCRSEACSLEGMTCGSEDPEVPCCQGLSCQNGMCVNENVNENCAMQSETCEPEVTLCCEDLSCQNGQCLTCKQDGESCTSDAQCCYGGCSGGFCFSG